MAAESESGALRDGLREYGGLASFSFSTLKELPGSARYASEVLRQAAILVRGSTLVLFVLPFFLGVTQTNYGYYTLRSAGAGDYAGLVSGVATPRLSALFALGYIFAAKVCCGLVSEIGAMKINEEIEAYDAEATSPRQYVVGTRVLGALLYTPIAAGVGIFGATVGSYVNTVYILNAVSAETFNRYHWSNQAPFDYAFGFTVALIMMVGMVLVACYYGFRTTGGPAGVGASSARSLLVNLVWVHVITGLAAFAVYGTNLGLPIGGVGSS
jgi:phospholipid/cholesterol/gamma-HCH transport system permease protein